MSSKARARAPALLVVDLQQALVEGFPDSDERRSTPHLTSNVDTVLSHWRRHKWPVIHIQHDNLDPDEPLNMDNFPGNTEPHACAKPRYDEPVLVKHIGSAFTDPNLKLEERLKDLGCEEVVVIGMDGAQCINDNARGACERGFKVTVVADACASFGMQSYGEKGKSYSPEETHDAAMSMLANGFARVVGTDALLKEYNS
ncbi:Isochorismatase-like protein [Exophiala viscosa]|uniref:Isochorismatase-like protein n=1 Tax=Exophiala viscosa TaxID=2486360 RepID=A0AAN6DWQ3_9EURO|nr:Isochorismatase-like protein [Exophiala viscosa]